jgi:hypothetical protein
VSLVFGLLGRKFVRNQAKPAIRHVGEGDFAAVCSGYMTAVRVCCGVRFQLYVAMLQRPEGVIRASVQAVSAVDGRAILLLTEPAQVSEMREYPGAGASG